MDHRRRRSVSVAQHYLIFFASALIFLRIDAFEFVVRRRRGFFVFRFAFLLFNFFAYFLRHAGEPNFGPAIYLPPSNFGTIISAASASPIIGMYGVIDDASAVAFAPPVVVSCPVAGL